MQVPGAREAGDPAVADDLLQRAVPALRMLLLSGLAAFPVLALLLPLACLAEPDGAALGVLCAFAPEAFAEALRVEALFRIFASRAMVAASKSKQRRNWAPPSASRCRRGAESMVQRLAAWAWQQR